MDGITERNRAALYLIPPTCTHLLPSEQKVGQFMAVCVGLLFLMVQGLAYTGFITGEVTEVKGTGE